MLRCGITPAAGAGGVSGGRFGPAFRTGATAIVLAVTAGPVQARPMMTMSTFFPLI